MKKIFLFFVMLLVCSISFGQTKRVYAKMVVDKEGKAVGRYLGTHGQNYRAGINDTLEVEVAKAGHTIATFSAFNGQGYVYVAANVALIHSRTDASSPVIARLKKDNHVCYPCINLKDEWFKITIDGKPGFVRQEEVEWTPMAF